MTLGVSPDLPDELETTDLSSTGSALMALPDVSVLAVAPDFRFLSFVFAIATTQEIDSFTVVRLQSK
jgi:hypothetical protein